MKICELCNRAAARMYCESDQASLCWECDAKVHSANFLVARHARALLCRSCQATTPWWASGARLSPIFSACELCAAVGKAEYAEEGEGGVEEGDVDVGDDDDDDDDSDVEEVEEEEEGENQVVPWTLTLPPSASSSSGEESSSPETGRARAVFQKRIGESSHLGSEKDRESHLPLHGPTLFPAKSAADEDVAADSVLFRHCKDRRRSLALPDARRPPTLPAELLRRRFLYHGLPAAVRSKWSPDS